MRLRKCNTLFGVSRRMASAETYETFVQSYAEAPILVEEDGDDFYVIAQFHTDKIIPKDVLRKYYRTAFNKEVRVFHISPETDVRSFVGNVNDIWWDDEKDAPFVKLQIYGDTPTARKMRQILREDFEKPLEQRRIKGISAGLLETRNRFTNQIVKFHTREVSLAREPVCEECTIEKITTFEDETMSSEDAVSKQFLALFENVKADLQSTIESQQELVEELHTKLERYEKTIILQKERIEQLEGTLGEQTTRISNFEKEVADERRKAEVAAKKPLVEKILTYERYDVKTDEGKKRLAELEDNNVKALSRMLKGYERLDELQKRGLTPNAQPSFSPGEIDPSQLTIGNFEMSPEQRVEATDRMLKQQASATREPGDHLGPVSGGY